MNKYWRLFVKRVYVDVVADLFHVGHVRLFERAKNEGDYLIVGVHSDASVQSYKRLPYIPEKHRYEMGRSCRFVDQVIEDAPLTITREFIDQHKIDLVIHGDDKGTHFEKQHSAAIKQGKMKYIPYTSGVSTSEIIKKIIERKEEKK